uniref:Uncharacterized protein n=1 Tax=Strongyloides venezuelensis TaxID=75913 RepID=A0A0K0FJS8_STRVS
MGRNDYFFRLDVELLLSSSERVTSSESSEDSSSLARLMTVASDDGASPGSSGVSPTVSSSVGTLSVPPLFSAKRLDPTRGVFKPWVSRLLQAERRSVVVLDNDFEVKRRRITRKRSRLVVNRSPKVAVTRVQSSLQIVPPVPVFQLMYQIA